MITLFCFFFLLGLLTRIVIVLTEIKKTKNKKKQNLLSSNDLFLSPWRSFVWTGNSISWWMCTYSVWASPIQKPRPTLTPKSRILRRPTTARTRASRRRTPKRRWRRRRPAQAWMSLTLTAPWTRKTLCWVARWRGRLVLPPPARAGRLPPGSTSCSTPSASLPGTAAWPTRRPRCAETPLPTSSVSRLPPPRHMTVRLEAAPTAEGVAGGRRVSRTAPLQKATLPCPYRLSTTKSWNAPSVALVSPRPRKTSSGLPSSRGPEGERKQALKLFPFLRCVPGSDPS